ncbi:MAG: hypothetical protein ACTSQQ_13830, partial [Candidatus Helarchaeota archaeon]
MKSSRFLGLFLISLFVLSSMLIFFNVVNNSKRDPSVFNDKVLINNSYVNVTHPSDLLLNGNDSTNQTISWTLSESAPYDYLGVYSFTGDGIGSDPTGWVVDEDPSTNVSVLAELDTHQYIVEFLDNTTIGAATMYDVFLSQSAGMIELYMRTSVANSENAFYLGNLPLGSWEFYLSMGLNGNPYWYSWRGSAIAIVDATLSPIPVLADTWYHVRISFNCTSDTGRFWINGTQAYWNNG